MNALKKLGYLLVGLVMLAIFAIFAGIIIEQIQAKNFDEIYLQGGIAIEANEIALGEIGTPKFLSGAEYVPNSYDFVTTTPRSFEIIKCFHVEVVRDARKIYAATADIDWENIVVDVSSSWQGGVLICPPEEKTTSTKVILWAVK